MGRLGAPPAAFFWYADRVDGQLLRTVDLAEPGGVWEVSACDLRSGATELASRLAFHGDFVLRGGATWLSDPDQTGS